MTDGRLHSSSELTMVTRRTFIDSALKGAATLAGGSTALTMGWAPGSLLAPDGGTRRRIRDFTLTAGVGEWDAGSGKAVRAWTYNGQLPGPELRVTEGDIVRVTLRNSLPEPTTIHWHGIPLPFAMDGVPDLTQPAVAPGSSFVYEFTATVPGTYWYHSHFAYQFERGLFGALVIDPARESLAFDREYTLVLDDWLHDPDRPVPSAMPYNMSVGGVIMGPMEAMQHEDNAGVPASDASDGGPVPNAAPGHAAHGAPMREPVFDAYTVNGRVARTQPALSVRRGERVRLRFINASTATVFPIYLAGHRLTVTHSDGQPVTPFETDVVAVGMGERVDVIVSANNPGAWRLASSDPKQRAKGLELALRYEGMRPDSTVSDVAPPKVSNLPYTGMEGRADRPSRPPDREYSLALRMEGPSRWTVNGKVYPDFDPLEVRRGERLRITVTNNSMFAHPVHLHGHFFDVVRPYGVSTDVRRPLRKDTLTLYHMDRHVIEFTADNPGPRWFLHCHNQYHHVGGMATEVKYV
jgi:FtsP/CotA-like multicopper oxidase with cupredoxin domain